MKTTTQVQREPVREMAIRVMPMVSLKERNSTCLGTQTVLSSFDQNSGRQRTHSMASAEESRRVLVQQFCFTSANVGQILWRNFSYWPFLTSLIANLPSCTNHTIMAADREVRSNRLPGTWGTDAAAY